ncbi:unknown [Acidaminococcus sp. CAG:917]|nr:unknown [Acidaminococcus sp. CAG:917]
MTLENFHLILGQTIMYCQIIEHDVKMIYAAMCKGDVYDTLAMIDKNKWTLGHSVKELKKLDFSDRKPYISADDYNFLSQMAYKRNYWCHKTYIQFIYNPSFLYSKEYEKECHKLQCDNEKLSSVYKALEKVRLNAMHDFNRL